MIAGRSILRRDPDDAHRPALSFVSALGGARVEQHRDSPPDNIEITCTVRCSNLPRYSYKRCHRNGNARPFLFEQLFRLISDLNGQGEF
jgi:hypothetical protein